MYRRIMVPVDLAHAERLDKALATAADMARRHGAEVVLVGVAGSQPGPVARSPEEFARRLEGFAAEAGARHDLPAMRAATAHVHDVVTDLDRVLIAKAGELDADLVVMGSHVPGAAEHVIGSNAGYVASHAPVSVFVVRG